MDKDILVANALMAMLELYRNHYGLTKDWLPSQADIDGMILLNNTYTTKKYEDEAADALGVPRLPSPII